MSRFDVVCFGELLLDCIADGDLSSATNFEEFRGGSAANLACNLTMLGRRAALVASVGEDATGARLVAAMRRNTVDATYIRRCDLPTSRALIARSVETAEFRLERSADVQILPEQVPEDIDHCARIAHTTCFALAQEPARSTIVDALATAADASEISLDANYAREAGMDRETAWDLVERVCQFEALVKTSLDDLARLFGARVTAEEGARRLREAGAQLAVVTLGARGSLVVDADGEHLVEPAPVEMVIDATGAGDAYWAAFLHARLSGATAIECGRAGAALAARKLAVVGPLQSD